MADRKIDDQIHKLSKRLVAVLEDLVAKKKFPACSAAIVCREEIVLTTAAGVVGEKAPATPETVFKSASISKTVLAILALQCQRRGELKLDDAINDHIPSPLVNPKHPSAVITSRHLLTHKSGLSDDESALQPGSKWRSEGKDCSISLAEYVKTRLADNRLWSNQTPGQARYHYSNAGMTLLGYVLECATKCPLHILARKRVFEPLGMNNTGYHLSEWSGIAGAESSRQLQNLTRPGGKAHYAVCEFPAAGMRSSASDLARYMCGIMSDGGLKKLGLHVSDRDEMLPSGFANGLAWWGKDTWYGEKTGDVWAHGGFMPGVRSHIYIWPQYRVGAAFLSNGEHEYTQVSALLIAMKDVLKPS